MFVDTALLTMAATVALGNLMRPDCERQQKYHQPTLSIRAVSSTAPLMKSERALTEIDFFGSFPQNTLSKYEALMAQIERFEKFPAGWDGEGTVPPSSASVVAAKSFILDLQPGIPMPTAMMTGLGEVEFFWNSKDGYADISFDQSGTASFFGRDSKNEEFFIDEIHSGAAGLLQTDRQILAVIARHLI